MQGRNIARNALSASSPTVNDFEICPGVSLASIESGLNVAYAFGKTIALSESEMSIARAFALRRLPGGFANEINNLISKDVLQQRHHNLSRRAALFWSGEGVRSSQAEFMLHTNPIKLYSNDSLLKRRVEGNLKKLGVVRPSLISRRAVPLVLIDAELGASDLLLRELAAFDALVLAIFTETGVSILKMGGGIDSPERCLAATAIELIRSRSLTSSCEGRIHENWRSSHFEAIAEELARAVFLTEYPSALRFNVHSRSKISAVKEGCVFGLPEHFFGADAIGSSISALAFETLPGEGSPKRTSVLFSDPWKTHSVELAALGVYGEWKDSIAIAVAEFIERLSLIDSYRRRRVEIGRLERNSSEVLAHDILSKTSRAIPISAISLVPTDDPAYSEFSDSSGTAAGTGRETAIQRACFELLERHCVGLWWHSGAKYGRLLDGSEESDVFSTDCSVTISYIDISIISGPAVAVCILECEEGLLVGSHCASSWVDAKRKALFDVVSMFQTGRNLKRMGSGAMFLPPSAVQMNSWVLAADSPEFIFSVPNVIKVFRDLELDLSIFDISPAWSSTFVYRSVSRNAQTLYSTHFSESLFRQSSLLPWFVPIQRGEIDQRLPLKFSERTDRNWLLI